MEILFYFNSSDNNTLDKELVPYDFFKPRIVGDNYADAYDDIYEDTEGIDPEDIKYNSLTGIMREASDILNPVITCAVEAGGGAGGDRRASPIRANYCYIPELYRYYYITNINIISEGIYELHLAVDVLMTYRDDIRQNFAIIDKQGSGEGADEYIDDGSLMVDNLMFQTVYDFPDGFLESPEIILITAG